MIKNVKNLVAVSVALGLASTAVFLQAGADMCNAVADELLNRQ